jgi:hypothetical protein
VRNPPRPPLGGRRPDRVAGAHQAHTSPTGPKRARKALAALLQQYATPPSLVLPSRRRHLQEAPQTPASQPAQAHLGPPEPIWSPSYPNRARKKPATTTTTMAPRCTDATPPSPPGRAGPKPPEEHRRQGEGGPHSLSRTRGKAGRRR